MLSKLLSHALSVTFLGIATVSAPAIAQEPMEGIPTVHTLQVQLDAQAKQIEALTQELHHRRQSDLQSDLGVVPDSTDRSCTPESVLRVPLVIEHDLDEACDEDAQPMKTHHKLNFFVDYDRGFSIVPFDSQKHPFRLNVMGWIQFRHHAFDRNVESWTDNAGVTRQVRSRNAFDIERGRLVFSGFAIDKRLTYFLQLDGDTDGAHGVDFFDYWWAWQANEEFRLQMGKRKVPASRQWLLGARRTRFCDRPMANDFFRPDRTVGIFGVGKFHELAHYQWMIGDGYRNANIPNALSDNRLTLALTNYFDPQGSYGNRLTDFDRTETPVTRIGHSFVYSSQASDRLGLPLDESDFVRLSDGTRLTQTGALASGATVSEFDIVFYGIDAAVKYQGWSFNSEVFLRWIGNIEGDQTLPMHHLTQHGWYAEGGRFLIDKKLDANLRYSQVSGEFGSGSEYALGFNWYPLEKPQMKVSFDVTALESSPLQNTTSDILVGDDGTLFRTQFQAEF